MEYLHSHGSRYRKWRPQSARRTLQNFYCTYQLSRKDNALIPIQTEKDFAAIAAAGLNWIRLPIPFWAIDKWDGEPFLEKVCWKCVNSHSL